VRFGGACDGCAASMLTFHAGVKKAITDACPEITEVILVKSAGGAAKTVHFISPFAADRWLSVGTLQEIPDGGVRALDAGGVGVILCRRGVVVTCFEDSCSHLNLGIAGGTITQDVITCPHHGFRYDLATGACLTAPIASLRAYEVRIAGHNVEIKRPG
jgi:nitrite reductase/ring-hydroxylating ferredoxin subunit